MNREQYFPNSGNSNLLLLALIGLLLLFVGYRAYVYFQDTQSHVRREETSTALIQEKLISGSTRLFNEEYGLSMIVPSKYEISGDADVFSVTYIGPESGEKGQRDFASLDFQFSPLNGKTFDEVADGDYRAYMKSNADTSSIMESITIGKTKGIWYACDFKVRQHCYYLPVSSDMYLFLLTNFEDSGRRGYEDDIRRMLQSLEIGDS